MSYIILTLLFYLFKVTAKCPSHCSLSEERIDCSNTSLRAFPTGYRKALNVSHDAISSVTRYCLWNISPEVHDMRNSVIESIDRFAFMGKDRVKEIDFSWNNITFIYPETFLFTPKLARLSLANNRFLALQNGLMFSGNSLKILDLSYCNISKLTTIKYGVSNLEELYLQHNTIMYLSSSSLDSLTNLKILNVGYNNLYSIDTDMFASLKGLTELKLESNHIPCDCHLREIYLRCLVQKIAFENMTCEENSEKDHKIDWSVFLNKTKCNYKYEMQKNMSATRDRNYNDESDAEDSDELSAVTITVIAVLVVVTVIIVCACLLNKSHDCFGAIGCALICTECLH
jgi:hypothetical protein